MKNWKPLNDRQRRFCEFIVQGLPAGRAYESAGYALTGDSADVQGCKLLKHPRVSEYLQKLREDASKSAQFTADDAVDFCLQVLRSKPSDASMDNPLCEVHMSKAGPFAAFPAKQAMLERLCKMLGLDKPQKVEVSASDKLAAALAAAAAAGRTVDDRDEI